MTLRFRIPTTAFAVCAAIVVPIAAAAADLRGFAAPGPMGVVLFQPCSGKVMSNRLLKVEDETPDAALMAGIDDIRKIMLDAGRPLYVEFRGDTVGQVAKARRFQRASGTITSCADAASEIPAAATLWATGEDPTWRLTADAKDVRLERPGLPPVRFPASAFAAGTAKSTKSPRIVDAWSAQDGGSIRVEIAEQMCSDGRSETAFGASVSVRYGSRTYQGCAARY